MSIQAAIRAVSASQTVANEAFSAWQARAMDLQNLGATTDKRLASIFGQCAHESAGFRVRFENLNYSAAGLKAIFGRHFSSQAERNHFARKPEMIANRVYSNRNGNGSEASGDGWRFRGRGYIQLTGRSNYRISGAAVGVDLESNPEQAANPDIAWMVAVRYMASRKRSSKTLLEWADLSDDLMVTKGINGGTNGLHDRIVNTAKALHALSGKTDTAEWQALLLAAGFDPGPIDGLMGPKTRRDRCCGGGIWSDRRRPGEKTAQRDVEILPVTFRVDAANIIRTEHSLLALAVSFNDNGQLG